jgi:glycosyltransferase involved in cell wall biosynthesis
MTIYTSPQVRSGYGEETFWVWAEREFPAVDISKASHPLLADDTLLRYSTLGPLATKARTIACCWELYPEMKVMLGGDAFDRVIDMTYRTAAACNRRTVASKFSVPYYEHCGRVDVLPIGVDTDLFREYSPEEKILCRQKHRLPLNAEIGLWVGTTHKMKGFARMQEYANTHPDIFWIVVFYGLDPGDFRGRGVQFNFVQQPVLPELMNCSDFQLSASMLRPFFIVEYEGMACNLPQRNISGLEKEWDGSVNPRQQILQNHWDRKTARLDWLRYINTTGA